MVMGGVLALRWYCFLCCETKLSLNTKYQLKDKNKGGWGGAGGLQRGGNSLIFLFLPRKRVPDHRPC